MIPVKKSRRILTILLIRINATNFVSQSKNKMRDRIIHEYHILVILSPCTDEVIVTFALQKLQNPNLSPIVDARHSTKDFLASLRKLNTNYFILSLRYCISTTPFYTKIIKIHTFIYKIRSQSPRHRTVDE